LPRAPAGQTKIFQTRAGGFRVDHCTKEKKIAMKRTIIKKKRIKTGKKSRHKEYPPIRTNRLSVRRRRHLSLR